MNKIILTGNIGKIEGQYTPKGKFVCKASLAVSIGWGDNKSTNWYNLTVWGDQGERFNEWVSKGTRIMIDGTLELREWEDKEGAKHLSPDVNVQYFEVLSKRKKEEEPSDDDPDYLRD